MIKTEEIFQWDYSQGDKKIGYVKRFEPSFDGNRLKDVIPYFISNGNGSFKKGLEKEWKKRPLFGLESIKNFNITVYVVEGEKAASAKHGLGFQAVTSLGGCECGHLGDWQKLNGPRRVVLIPDNDEPGEKFIKAVANQLVKLNPMPEISVCRLPGLPDKGDIVDWLQMQPELSVKNGFKWNGYETQDLRVHPERDILRDRLKEFVKAHCQPIPSEWTQSIKSSTPEPEEEKSPWIEEPSPPLDFGALPNSVKELLGICGPTTLSPNEFLITSFLAFMSAVIGTRAYVKLGTRTFFPTIWSFLIAGSSDSFKSTAIKIGRSFLDPIGREYQAEYIEAYESYERELREYKSLSDNESTMGPPEPPQRKRVVYPNDMTFEALCEVLYHNHDGGCLSFDEGASWVESFGRYNGGGEKSRYMSIYGSDPMEIKRKTGNIDCRIEDPFISIIAAITKNGLLRLFKGVVDIENGFLPRFLLCYDPPLIKTDLGSRMPDTDKKGWDGAYRVFRKVMDLRPGKVNLSEGAIDLYDQWYWKTQEQKNDQYFPDELKPFLRRMEGYCLKFALIFHLFKKATEEELNDQISQETLFEAISLSEYFKGQAKQVAKQVCQTGRASVFEEILEVVRALGGKNVSPTQIRRKKTKWRTQKEEVEKNLSRMINEGVLVRGEPNSRGPKTLRVSLPQKS